MKQSKRFSAVCFTFAAFCISIRKVNAYVDPSVLTYAIQAIAGIAITLGTVAGLYGRKLVKLFGLTEGNDKASDISSDDLEFHDPKTNRTIRALGFLDSDQVASLKVHAAKNKNEKLSLKPGLLITAAVSFLWMFYSPLMLYLTNTKEFRYDLYSILPTVLLMFAVGMAVGTIVYFLALKSGKHVYTFIAGFGVVFLLITFIQGNFLAGNLPALDGTRFDWSGYGHDRIISLVLCIVCIVFVGLSCWFLKRLRFLRAAGLFSAVLTVVMAVTLIITGIQTGGFSAKRSASVTSEGEFTYSSDQNFIILVIDAADSGMFRKLMETTDPEYPEVFRDFTYFPNTVGCYTYTEHAIPYILSGIWMENQEDFTVFETKAMEQSPLFLSLESKGYRMGMYEDQLTYDSNGIFRFENVKNDRFRLDSFGEYARQSFYMTWFQYMPYQLKPLLSRDDMLSNLQNRAIGENEAFVSRNTVFHDALKEKDITLTDEKCFRFIHLEGAHVPFRYDKDANEIPMEEGSYEQNMQASVTIVNAYLEKLRESGVYDNSAIIVMADHGFTEEEDALLGRSNPILFCKGVNETHDMILSEQPVSYEDLQEFYERLMSGRTSDELSDYSEGDSRLRRFLSYDYNTPQLISEYFQHGYAADFSTLEPTGTVYRQN